MLKNYFKIALRNLKRHAGFTFINIAGLSLGLTACFLIGLFVWDEKHYDTSIPEGDQVYRIYNEYSNSSGTENRAPAPPMFATTLKQDFAEVEKTARVLMLPQSKILFEAGQKKLYEESGFYVDSTFFDVFPLPFTYGSSTKALDDPGAIVISAEMAARFFGKENPTGKQIL